MTVDGARWNALPHSPIEELSDGLWCVQAPAPGIPLQRVMTLVRLDDGRIVIHSAVVLDERSMSEIEAWGRPAFLVVPSRYHKRDAPAYKRRYPDLCVLCPRGARSIVERVLAVDGDYDAFPAAQCVRLKHLEGTAAREGVMIVERESETTLVFNDVIFDMPHLSGVSGFVLRYITRSSGGPRTSRIARRFIVDDKPKLAAEFRQLAETPRLKRIIVAHHRVIADDPAGVLRELARAL